MRSKRLRVTREMPLEELPQLMTRAEVQEYFAIGKSLSYCLLQRYGVKVGNLHRLARGRIPDIQPPSQQDQPSLEVDDEWLPRAWARQ